MKLTIRAKLTQEVLYHLLNQDKMKFVLDTNSLKPWNFSQGISTTRDPHLTSYIGDGPLVIFRLVLDVKKLSKDFKIKSTVFRSQTGISFDEEQEELIVAPEGIPNVKQYLKEIQILRSAYDKWKGWMDETPEDDFDRKQQATFKEVMRRLPSLAPVRFV